MTKTTPEQILYAWNATMHELEEAIYVLNLSLGSNPESSLMKAINALQELATKQAAELVGVSQDWLDAWWLECNFGDKPLQAGLVGEELRTITTLEELMKLILDDLKT